MHTAMLLVRSLDARNTLNKTRALMLFSHYVETLSCEVVLRKSIGWFGKREDESLLSLLQSHHASASSKVEVVNPSAMIDYSSHMTMCQCHCQGGSFILLLCCRETDR